MLKTDEGRTLVLEETREALNGHHDRQKRAYFDGEDKDGDHGNGHILVYESAASGGECGIKEKNRQRMRAPETMAVRLKGKQGERQTAPYIAPY